MVPRPDSASLQGYINLHLQLTAILAVKNIFVLHDWMWKSVFSSSVWGFWWNWLIYRGEPFDWDPQDVFVMGRRVVIQGRRMGGMRTFHSSSAANMLEWMSHAAASPPSSLLAAGSGNVDTRSTEQPQKPQESPREDAGREGEVEPWNALGGVSHLFTSWTQWTLPESATSTTASLSHLSLPLSSLFCSLTYPNAPHLLSPPLPSPYWQTLGLLAADWLASSPIP